MADALPTKVPTKCRLCNLLRGSEQSGYCAANGLSLPKTTAGSKEEAGKDDCSMFDAKH